MEMFLLSGFKQLWTSVYNALVRNSEPYVRGAIIISLILLALIFLVFSMKGKEKVHLINNWTCFWIFMLCSTLTIVYVFMLSTVSVI